MNFSFSAFTFIEALPLAMQPSGFGPKPKKSPKMSLIFFVFSFLLFLILLLPGDRTGLFSSSLSSTYTTFFYPLAVTIVFLFCILYLLVGDVAYYNPFVLPLPGAATVFLYGGCTLESGDFIFSAEGCF